MMSSKSSESGDASASAVCVECGGSMIPNQKKICTSCESDRNAAFERRVKREEELFNDDKMFADPPPKDDCQICLLQMPYEDGLCGVFTVYMPCCGKLLCSGCTDAETDEMMKGNLKPWCSYCRVPRAQTNEEYIKRCKKRMELDDAEAFNCLAHQYYLGNWGLSKDVNKALELWNKAAELGSCRAHFDIGSASVRHKIDIGEKDFIYHFKLAAIGGHEMARYMVGNMVSYDVDRSMKHLIIAARAGNDESLKKIGEGYKAGHVTKDEYASTLRAHKDSQDEMKSEQRTKASARAITLYPGRS